MNLKSLIVSGALGLMSALVNPAAAHHSFAAHYIPEKRMTVTGTVTKFDYRSPHSLVFIDVTGADGAKQSWMLEFGSALTLSRLGWNAKTLMVGDLIEAVGMPSRTGAARMNVMELRRAADGFEYKAKPNP